MKILGLVCSFINATVLSCAASTELKDFSTSSTHLQSSVFEV